MVHAAGRAHSNAVGRLSGALSGRRMEARAAAKSGNPCAAAARVLTVPPRRGCGVLGQAKGEVSGCDCWMPAADLGTAPAQTKGTRKQHAAGAWCCLQVPQLLSYAPTEGGMHQPVSIRDNSFMRHCRHSDACMLLCGTRPTLNGIWCLLGVATCERTCCRTSAKQPAMHRRNSSQGPCPSDETSPGWRPRCLATSTTAAAAAPPTTAAVHVSSSSCCCSCGVVC